MNHQPAAYGLQQPPPSVVAQQPQQSGQSTMLWAQENRFVDSGVHTAAVPTNASSSVLSGRMSLNNNEQAHFGGGTNLVPPTFPPMEGYPNNGYQQIYTPSMASSELCLTHNFGGSENGQYMTPDPRLTAPGGYYFNYQDEADFYDVIREVAKCLSDEDQVVVSKASEFLEDYCKQPGNAMAIVKEFHFLLPIFTGLIRSSKDLSILRYLTGTFKHLSTFNFGRTALLFYGLLPDILNLLEVNNGVDQIIDRKIGGTLYNLSLDDQGRRAIYDCGAIHILIKMLESASDSVVYHAITALHNLILHHPNSADFIRTSGSIRRFTMLIKPSALPKFLAILIDCLYQLASEHAETKIEILNTGCIPELVKILTTFEYENLLLTTARLLQALGVCKQNKQAIVAAGGLNALAHRLSHPSHRLLSSVLLAIRNMSDGAGQMNDEDAENLVTAVLRLLGSIDLNVVGWCTAILANLTCNNVKNKLTVFRNGGVRDLLRTIEVYHPANYAAAGGGQHRATAASKAEYAALIVETLDSTLSVLRHVTARHPQACDAQKELRAATGGGGGGAAAARRTGLHSIVDLINGPPNATQPTLLKPALRLLNDLAGVQENAQILYECGLSVHLFNHFSFQFDRLKHLLQQQSLNNNNNNNGQEAKICADVTNGCLSVSQVLCRYPLFKSFFRQDQVIDAILRTLMIGPESLQQNILAILAEVITEQGIAAKFLQCSNEIHAKFTELAFSGVETKATLAAKILEEITKAKNQQHYSLANLSLQENATFINQYQNFGNGEQSWSAMNDAESSYFSFLTNGDPLELDAVDAYGMSTGGGAAAINDYNSNVFVPNLGQNPSVAFPTATPSPAAPNYYNSNN